MCVYIIFLIEHLAFFVCALQLVVHVGVSGMATTVTLEKCGHNYGYRRLDNCNLCPKSGCCMEGGPDCINTIIDMDVVCKRVNNSDLGVSVSVSKDAGRYVVHIRSEAQEIVCSCNNHRSHLHHSTVKLSVSLVRRW